jgi:hypothetical protein
MASTAGAAANQADRWVRWAGRGLLLAALILYIFTLDTGFQPYELEGGDPITHQYAQVQARPSNAPGYPLYTMGGWLWFHGLRNLFRLAGNPLPNPIPILSSYSTIWALLALWLFYRLICRVTRSEDWPAGNWPLAWLLSAFYGVTYFFWYYATTTEQYSSAVAQTLAIVYVYLLWRDAIDEPPERYGKSPDGQRHPPTRIHESRPIGLGYLLLLAFLSGLSLAHMVTVALIVPPLVWLVLRERPELLRRPGVVLAAILIAMLPLSSYAYVYLRGAAHPEWWGNGDWKTATEWFWSFIRTSQGQEELSWGLEAGRPFFTDGFPRLIWQELSWPIVLLGLVGIAGLGRRLAVLLYTTLALYFVLCWVDRFGNWFQVILPAYPLLLLGIAPIVMDAQRLAAQTRRRWLQAVPLIVLLLAVGWRGNASLPAADSRDRPGDTALIRPALLLDQALPPQAGLFAEKADALGLNYLIEVWGIRPDLQVISSQDAAAFLRDDRPVLATWQATPLLLDELPTGMDAALRSISADWVRIFPAGQAREEDQLGVPDIYLGQDMGDGVVLVGYSYEPGPRGKPVVSETVGATDVTLYWKVSPGTHPENWSISVRPAANGAPLTGPDGAPILQDRPGPVHGLLKFGELEPDRVVRDPYRLPIGDLEEVMVILYRPTGNGFENLIELLLPLRKE